MWSMAGVDEDDRLDRAAAAHVLRRAGRMLRPYRRQLRVTVVLSSSPSPWCSPARSSSVRHRPRHPQGDAGALNLASPSTSPPPRRLRRACASRSGWSAHRRGLPARPAGAGLRPPPAAAARLARPAEDRRGGQPAHSDIDSLAELVQMGLLMFVGNGLLLVGSSCWRRVVAAAAGHAGGAAGLLASVKFQRLQPRLPPVPPPPSTAPTSSRVDAATLASPFLVGTPSTTASPRRRRRPEPRRRRVRRRRPHLLRVLRVQVVLVKHGEGFCATCGAFDHLQRLSLGCTDRRPASSSTGSLDISSSPSSCRWGS